jgi:hypothetical protein
MKMPSQRDGRQWEETEEEEEFWENRNRWRNIVVR